MIGGGLLFMEGSSKDSRLGSAALLLAHSLSSRPSNANLLIQT